MESNKKITLIVIAAVVVISLIAVFSFMSLDKTLDENNQQQTGPIITPELTQEQAEQAALDANYDWVLELNSLGRAEVYDANLEGNTWKVRVRNYQRPEDQKGYLLVYSVDLYSGAVDNRTTRQEVN